MAKTMKKNSNKLSWVGFVKNVFDVGGMTPQESRITARALLFKWKEKSDFDNEVNEVSEIVKEEMKNGVVEEKE
ncbi:MAG: hypothetical protein WA057_01585 [Candidatus Magasanikiibacteriota bacterium]